MGEVRGVPLMAEVVTLCAWEWGRTMYYFARAAITKYHRLGSLNRN